MFSNTPDLRIASERMFVLANSKIYCIGNHIFKKSLMLILYSNLFIMKQGEDGKIMATFPQVTEDSVSLGYTTFQVKI